MSPPPQKISLLQKLQSYFKVQIGFFPIILLTTLGITSTCLIFYLIHHQEKEEIRKTFDDISTLQISHIKGLIKDAIEIVEPLSAFYAASQEVEREEFSIFAQNLLSKHKSIQAIEWVPFVTEKNRARYETEARKAFPHFTIQKKGPKGTMIPVDTQDFYLPVYFVTPYEGNESALGFDLAAHPIRKKAIMASWRSGKIVATEPIELRQTKEAQMGILVFAPVYQKNPSTEENPFELLPIDGFVLSVLKMDDLLKTGLQVFSAKKIDLFIQDMTSEHSVEIARFMRNTPDAPRKNPRQTDLNYDLTKNETVLVAGRKWQITTHADFSDFERVGPSSKWGISLSGFLITGFLSAYFLKLKKQKEDRLISVKNLEEEVIFRRALETRLNLALDAANGAVWDWNIKTGDVKFTPRWFNMIGYKAGELPARVGTWKKIICPEDLSSVRKTLTAHLKGQTDLYEHETRLCRKSGEILWTLDRGKIISRNDKGKALRMIGISTDITERKMKEETIQLQSEITANMAEGAFLCRADTGIIVYANPKCEAVFAYETGELIGKHFAVLNAPEKHPSETLTKDITASIKAYGLWRGEIQQVKKDETCFWGAYTVSSYHHAQYGRVWLVIHTDISDRKKAEEIQRLSSAVFDNAREGIMITDAKRKIVSINPAFTAITGYTLNDVQGKDPKILKSGRHDDTFYETMWHTINKNKHWQGELWDKKKNGEIHAKWLSITAIENQEGKVQQYIGLFSDITNRKSSEDQLHVQAYYDALTGLPNRRLLKDRLSQALSQANRTETKVGLLFVDLDHFKHVNDTLGHLVGDTILNKTAQRLLSSVRKADTVSRSGGDEFQIILPNISTPKEAMLVAKKIIEQISAPFQIKNREVFLGVSIGITVAPDDGIEAETLIRNADMAMYKAKSQKHNSYYFFSEHMEKTAKKRAVLEWDLRRALTNQELLIVYQPIMSLNTLKTVAVEALLRWRHPEQGLLLPDQFIPIAEETGLIREIGDFVLQTACRQMAIWHNRRNVNTTLSVNMSSHQFIFNDFMSPIAHALETSGLPAESLVIEVTESLTLDPVDQVVQKLSQLKKLGVGLAIDDFGTGYSSLSYLARFPIDRLKIDKSFIQDISCNPQKTDIVEAIIRMGQSMKMEVIAEGIEKEEELDRVKALGCNAAQGYYFSKPLSVEAYDKVLSR